MTLTQQYPCYITPKRHTTKITYDLQSQGGVLQWLVRDIRPGAFSTGPTHVGQF